MLIEFTVGNFLSFKEPQTFSMVGTKAMTNHEGQENELANIFYSPKQIKLLKSSIFYGANNSGKSNLIKALGFFRNFIIGSYNEQKPEEDIKGIVPFLLSTETEAAPSFFEMIFVVENIQYRYGFEVDREKIYKEWLYSSMKRTETPLFTRTIESGVEDKAKGEFKNKDFQKAINKRPNSLFLSALAQFGGEVALKIQTWFLKSITIINTYNENSLEKIGQVTIHKFLHESKFREQLTHFFQSIKIGFSTIDIQEENKNVLVKNENDLLENLLASKFPKDLVEEFKGALDSLKQVQDKMQSLGKEKREKKTVAIKLTHNKLDKVNTQIDEAILGFVTQSIGTQKLFSLFGIWIECIEKGKILIVDELDSSLHTLLTQELIKLFHTKTNQQGQLICAVHDTNLLKGQIFRRDQVWFAEKNNETGATDLYSLVEFKDALSSSPTVSFEEGYLEGRYGAIPYLGDIQKFLNDFIYAEE